MTKTERLGTPEQEIQKRLNQVQALLEEARVLSGNNTGYFYFSGPRYGMGGWLENGEWRASSGSC